MLFVPFNGAFSSTMSQLFYVYILCTRSQAMEWKILGESNNNLSCLSTWNVHEMWQLLEQRYCMNISIVYSKDTHQRSLSLFKIMLKENSAPVSILFISTPLFASLNYICDPVDFSPPGSSVHGILQARILEWVAISFSRGSSWPRDWTQVSHIAGRCFNLWATREAPIYSFSSDISYIHIHNSGTIGWGLSSCGPGV